MEMAYQIAKLLRKQRPDPNYVKKVFQYVREDLSVRGGAVRAKQLPEFLIEDELKSFYTAIWNGLNWIQVVILKVLFFYRDYER